MFLRLRFSLRFLLVVITLFALCAAGYRRYAAYRALKPQLTPLTMNGDQSMEPFLEANVYFVADMNAYRARDPERWDAVVFDVQPGHTASALRVVGLPGETVSFENERIFINGVVLDVPPRTTNPVPYHLPSTDIKHPYRVPENSYYLLGDNPAPANDSRVWGALPREKIVGRVER